MKVRSCALRPAKKPVWVRSLTRIMAKKTADIIISSLLESLRASKAFCEGKSTWEKVVFLSVPMTRKEITLIFIRVFCWSNLLNWIYWNLFFSSRMCFFSFSKKSIFWERIWSKFIVEISIPDAGVSSHTCTMVHFCPAGSPRLWLRSCWQPSQRSHSQRLTHQADHGNAPSTAGNAYVNLWTILYPPFTASLPRSPWRQHPALRPDNRIQQLNSVFLTLSLIAYSGEGWWYSPILTTLCISL